MSKFNYGRKGNHILNLLNDSCELSTDRLAATQKQTWFSGRDSNQFLEICNSQSLLYELQVHSQMDYAPLSHT